MERTEYIKLKKPGLEDFVKVDDLNDNSNLTDKHVKELSQGLLTKAPLNSPEFVGTPTAPRPESDDPFLYERIATTGYVKSFLMVKNLDEE